MHCIQVSEFGGPDRLVWKSTPDPQPGPGQLLVRLEAAGVNPVDTYIRSGIYGARELPYTPGTDGAGRIEQVGPDADGAWKVGQRVYLTGSLTGTYAELVLCEPQHLQPLPEHVSAAQGAALYVPYSTAYRALFQRGQAQPGEWVLIHGASGGVGLAAVQWAAAHGLRVIGTAGSPAGLEAVLSEGAEHALDHHSPDYAEQVRDLSGGGPDLILEMLANVNLQKDLDLVNKYGRIVVIGNRGSLEFNPRAAMTREADVRGMNLFNTPPALMARIQAAIGAGLRNRSLRPVVGRSFPLSQAALAHEAVLKPGSLGKIVLIAEPQTEPAV